MMALTHCVLGVSVVSVALGSADPLVLSFAAIASQLPDVDTSTSTIGRILFPFSRYLERRYPHRSVTHSFIATAVFAAVVFPVTLLNQQFWAGLAIGYWMGWFGDVFTKSGVQAFFPSQARLVIPGNPRLRLSTNSPNEYFLLAVLLVTTIVSININSSGGILRNFNQVLGIPSGAIEIASAEGSRYLLLANVEGRNAVTQQPVQKQFEIIKPLTQNDLLVRDGQILYRVGSSQEAQVIANRITIDRVRPIRQKAHEIQLEEESIADAVEGLKGQRVYVTGTITLFDAEDLVLANYQDRFDAIRLQPAQGAVIIHIESASPAEIAQKLGDYDGNGSLVVRTVEVL